MREIHFWLKELNLRFIFTAKDIVSPDHDCNALDISGDFQVSKALDHLANVSTDAELYLFQIQYYRERKCRLAPAMLCFITFTFSPKTEREKNYFFFNSGFALAVSLFLNYLITIDKSSQNDTNSKYKGEKLIIKAQ